MSHTVKVDIQLTDIDVLKKACQRLNLSYSENQTVKLYDSQEYNGFVIHLKDWRYPVIIKDKQIFYDNYNGNWGNIKELNNLKTYYGVEKVKKLARAKGYTYKEVLVNNSPQIHINI